MFSPCHIKIFSSTPSRVPDCLRCHNFTGVLCTRQSRQDAAPLCDVLIRGGDEWDEYLPGCILPISYHLQYALPLEPRLSDKRSFLYQLLDDRHDDL